MTKQTVVIGLLALGLAACGTGMANDGTPAEGKTAGTSFFSSKRTVASGTTVGVTLHDELSSRVNGVGNAVSATVSSDVLDAKGKVVIPAGSPVAVHISALASSDAGDHNGDGVIEVTVTSVTVNGVAHNLNAVVTNVPHTMKGRGVTTKVQENLAVGTAVGAIAGKLIGKSTRSTVIGGAAGAVAGGAVSVSQARRDIIVAPGTHISFSMPQAMTIATK